MLDTAGHDEKFARPQFDNPVPELDPKADQGDSPPEASSSYLQPGSKPLPDINAVFQYSR
ncbi:MAG TPA: hypothetical protein VGK96_19835 [Candidatus Sulfotelmatobacter sp.]|jgi:hypothetical protein